MTDRPPVVALFGATALGKSDVAVELAASLGAEVVVADSMQVYAGLGIVTNQPTPEQRRRARHHLVGCITPQEELTVARFAALAHDVIDRLTGAGTPVVVEGGSGLYLRAALGDLAFAGAPDETERRLLEERWAADPAEVVAELVRLDPDAAARVDRANPRRVVRAVEAARAAHRASPAGTPAPSAASPPRARSPEATLWDAAGRYEYRLFALAPDQGRAALNERIGRRVDEMLAAGALEEVATARAAGPFSRTAAQAIGVRELCGVLDGELALAEAAARMKARTRTLARRQLTWMRKLPAARVVAVEGRRPALVAADLSRLLAASSW